MEYKHWEYFVCIVQEGSFTKAAQRLYLSQPALSKTLKLLEEETGLKLLNRSNKKIELTADGEKIYRRAKECVDSVASFTNFLDELKNRREGVVSVGVPPGIVNCALGPVLLKFYETCPNISIHFVEAGAHAVDQRVQENQVDFGITIEPVDADGLWVEPLVQDTYALVVEDTHPICRYDVLTGPQMRELNGEKFIAFEASFKSFTNIERYFDRLDMHPAVVSREFSYSLMADLACRCKGFTILPRRVAVLLNPVGIRVIPILDLSWNVDLTYKKNRPLTHIQKTFFQFIREKR